MTATESRSLLRAATPVAADRSADLLSAYRKTVAEQRKRLRALESALLEAQQQCARLSATADCSAEAMYSSRDGLITSWNRGAEELYGYSAADVIGLPVEIVYPRGGRGELAGIAARLASGETIGPHRTVRRRRDGSSVQVSLSLSPVLDHNGQVCGIAAVGRDLSETDRMLDELRKSEALYRSIVESSEDGITLWRDDSSH